MGGYLQGTNDGEDTHTPPNTVKYIKLTHEHFDLLMNTCATQNDTIAKLMTSPDSTTITSNQLNTRPAYYTNAKFEENSCRAIKSMYDGSEVQLTQFITILDPSKQTNIPLITQLYLPFIRHHINEFHQCR